MTFQSLFGKPKAIITMAHFPPMPGQPLHDEAGGVAALIDAVRRDVEILADSGVDAVMFCNEGDRPYRTQTGPEVPAVMAAAITQIIRRHSVRNWRTGAEGCRARLPSPPPRRTFARPTALVGAATAVALLRPRQQHAGR